MSQTQAPLTFPCQFPIKVIGKATEAFEIEAITLIRKFAPNLPDNAFSFRDSKEKNYIALTVVIPAESQEQLDNIYKALSESPLVIMAL